jgi:O-antigen/teichoic acid export membrane protein
VEPTVARPSLVRGGSLVAPALTLLNLVGYVLTVGAARVFDHDAYGRLNAFLGVLLVASVPALGVQTVVARSLAQAPKDEPRGARERALLRRATQVGLVASGATALAAPLLAVFLHTSVAGPLWVSAQIAPLTVLSAALGVVQGRERFRALAALIGVQAGGKLVGLVPLVAGGSVTDLLAALAFGTTLAAAIGLAAVGRGNSAPLRFPLPSLGDLGLAATGLLTVLVLANLDVLLARNLLSGDQAGRYSAGAVLAKVAFWLPQAVAVVIFPRLADPSSGRDLLRKAVLFVAAMGALEVAGCLLLAGPVLELTFGASYRSLSGVAWLWVVQGVGLSIVQLLVYRAIATGDTVTGRFVAGAAALEAIVLLAVSPTTPTGVISLATGIVVALTALLLTRRSVAPGIA